MRKPWEFTQWGITREDVQFVPYWRNQTVVKDIAPGLIASLWRRPGSAVIAIMNYGPDAQGQEQTRAAKLTLDLGALGIPGDAVRAGGQRLRIRQLYNHPVQAQYLRHLKWVKDFLQAQFPGQQLSYQNKPLPPIEPKLDAAHGTISGFAVNYHDVKFLAVDWEDKAIDESRWKELAADAKVRAAVLDWGINGATRLAGAEVSKLIKPDSPAIQVEAWRREGSVLLRVTNTATPAKPNDQSPDSGTIKLDLKGLSVDVRKLWAEFTSVVSLDGQPVENRESAEQKRHAGISFNAYAGEVYYKLSKGQTRVFCLDRY